MKNLFIYELDLTGGTCGFPAQIQGQAPVEAIRNELIRRSRITTEIKNKLKIDVQRIILKNIGLLDNEIVKNFIKIEGIKAFPLFFFNNKIIHFGNFPEFEIIKKKISTFKK